MKRPIVAAVAIGAGGVLIAAVIGGAVVYRAETAKVTQQQQQQTVAITEAQIAEYRRIVAGWPYPFASNDAVPKSPPTMAGSPNAARDRTFVSFFYQCSWVNALINGPASTREVALVSLRAWNDLPTSVSTADNTDGNRKANVLDPAASGDLTAMTEYFATCTPYQTSRIRPEDGLRVNRPFPGAKTPIPSSSASFPGRADIGTGMVGPYPVEIPIDNGASNFATGTVTLDSSGRPATYVVAKGDVIDYVAKRFGFFSPNGAPFDYLNTINQVRRGGYPWPIYAGDTLNLSAFTVTSVGSINGKVLNEAAPSPLPMQK